MSSPPPAVETFKGTSWEECHKFIVAIRARALWEGKQRDPAWIADFAAPLFWRKALSWHCRLPEDVRQDWSKLEIALIDRWPEPEDDDEPQMEPTPAAAPSLTPDDKAKRPFQGIIKAVVDGSNTSYYLKLPSPVCYISSDISEAIHVRYNSLSKLTRLEPIDPSCDSWLALHLASTTLNIRPGSIQFAYITSIDLDTLKSSWSCDGPFQFLTALTNGEVIPVWKKDKTSQITLTPFVRDSEYLYLAVDAEAYAGVYTLHKRAKLFIEPTN